MPCISNTCRQGRTECQTPYACNAAELHRYTPPITRNGGESIDTEDEPAALSWALFAVVVFFAIGIVLLPFILGAA